MEKKKKHIILIGFMGSGKTSVGIKLSYRLKCTFMDTDNQIEQRQGRSISEIFATDGEAAFRQMETECLKSLLLDAGNNMQIFSTGGGTPVREENRNVLKELGTVIYLKVTPEVVYERLKKDTTRPLLQTENPKAKIEQLLSDRKEAYEDAADVIVEVDEKNLEEIVEEIAGIVEREEDS